MSEPALETKENAAMNWLGVMGLEIDQEVLILPLAGQAGQGLQGVLVAVVMDQTGPMMIIIQQAADKPRVSIPWSSIMMITRPTAPPVPVEGSPTDDVSVEQLIEMAEKMGVAVPNEIRDVAAAK